MSTFHFLPHQIQNVFQFLPANPRPQLTNHARAQLSLATTHGGMNETQSTDKHQQWKSQAWRRDEYLDVASHMLSCGRALQQEVLCTEGCQAVSPHPGGMEQERAHSKAPS
jgi:hypothetical protein